MNKTNLHSLGIPLELRERFDGKVFIAPSKDQKLLLLNQEQWNSIKETIIYLSKNKEDKSEYQIKDIPGTPIDNNGRIMIPAESWEHLGPKGDLVFTHDKYGVELKRQRDV